MSHGCFGFLGAVLLCAACQSSTPAESREPSAASAQPAPSATPAAQATQPLKGSAPDEPSAGAPTTEPAAVKLAASPPPAEPLGDKAAGDKAAGKETRGSVVSEEAFSTWLQLAAPAKAGAPVQLEAVLIAKPPYHCNPEYPHKFKLSAAPAGLAYPEETVRGMKVTPERSVLAIPVNAQSAGKPTVSGTLSFSVCTAERCMVEKRDLSLALDVM